MSTSSEPQSFGLRRNSLWDGFTNVSYRELEKAADRIVSFREDVPDNVRNRLDVVRRLIRHSYFEYDFMDVAAERTLFTFEMALKSKLRDLGREPGEKPLAKLIEWGAEGYLFERGEEAAHAVRNLRNHEAHPDRNGRKGPAALHLTEQVVWMINEMYADREQRKDRFEKRKALQGKLGQAVEDGAVLEGVYDQEGNPLRLLIHNAQVLLVDNRSKQTVYHVAACPVFDPTPSDAESKKVEIADPIHVEASYWKEPHNVVRLVGRNGECTIHPIEKKKNQRRYLQKWKQKPEEDRKTALTTLQFLIGELRKDLRRHLRLLPFSSKSNRWPGFSQGCL
jgi:hypothetical protein